MLLGLVAYRDRGDAFLTRTHDFTDDLGALLSRKPGGQFEPCEVRHAIDHLLSALQGAREAGIAHGPVRMDEVLVDRRSRLLVELVGVGAALSGQEPDERDEVRSVVAIAGELLTGVPSPDGTAFRSLRGRTGHRWRAWLRDAPLRTSCAEARDALPA